jgi:hydrogenase maturation protein HypF
MKSDEIFRKERDQIRHRRLRATVRGTVQGVGFRPFLFRLSSSLSLTGWVKNTLDGVIVETEGTPENLEEFLARIEEEKPIACVIVSIEPIMLDPVGYTEFKILPSDLDGGAPTASLMPDLGTCPECLAEIFDPSSRRYRYPFTNCTDCGPRYSIIEKIPYDRANTTMRRFKMCPECQQEYDDPNNRRFHAQPNACPVCGPRLSLWSSDGDSIATGDDALKLAADAVLHGKILAIKGIGGFQLLVDAQNDDAVRRLRERKGRDDKPLALMFPNDDQVKSICLVDRMEARLLKSPQAPITLLRRRITPHPDAPIIAPSIAPLNPDLGVMLPYSPLHHLLMAEIGRPIVATSGNISNEPICIDEHEASERLHDVADLFLVHDRPIARHVDDSVARVTLGREMILRRARGYAPLPLSLRYDMLPTLAMGAQQKSTIAIAVGSQAVVSQHVGDLETDSAIAAYERVILDLENMYEVEPVCVAADLHPDYVSTKSAQQLHTQVLSVQHHYAHVLSCMTENQLDGIVLGVAWDGNGYGPDGTIWGGEFLVVDDRGFERYSSLAPFRLPGGDEAVLQPRRSALGVLYEIYGGSLAERDIASVKQFSPGDLNLLIAMMRSGASSPLTTSMGRLFDAVASILDVRQTSGFDGQAASDLEYLARSSRSLARYPVTLREAYGRMTLDWKPMVESIARDVADGARARTVAKTFHNSLAYATVLVASAAGIEQVALSGGCFQNELLTELCVNRLREAGFKPYWHQRVPPNDGGISLGQLAAAQRFLTKSKRYLLGEYDV